MLLTPRKVRKKIGEEGVGRARSGKKKTHVKAF